MCALCMGHLLLIIFMVVLLVPGIFVFQLSMFDSRLPTIHFLLKMTVSRSRKC